MNADMSEDMSEEDEQDERNLGERADRLITTIGVLFMMILGMIVFFVLYVKG